MSTINATIEVITGIQAIPGKDTIVSAEVAGFPVVVKQSEFQEGDAVAYFPMELELPPFVARTIGVENYLKKGRVVKAVKLGGYPSYGLILPLTGDLASLASLEVGTVIDDFFGTRKYVPQASGRATNSNARESHPLLFKYTDIERVQKYVGFLQQSAEGVIATEKIHGTNVRIGMVNGELVVGSRQLQRDKPVADELIASDWWWFPTLNENLMRWLTDMGSRHNQVLVYGETFGKGVQGGFSYGRAGLDFRIFDILIDGKYVDAPQFLDICNVHNLPNVPVDHIGDFNLDWLKEVSQRPSQLTDSHIREGIVIRPLREREERRVGRVIFKLLNPEYDIKKSSGKIEDATDE